MAVPEQEPIAIIGMACRFPGGSDSPSKLWDLIQSPRDLSKRVPADRFDITGFSHTNGSQHGATNAPNAYFIEEDVTRFDNTFFNIQPAEAEAIDPQQRLVMETVYDSLYVVCLVVFLVPADPFGPLSIGVPVAKPLKVFGDLIQPCMSA